MKKSNEEREGVTGNVEKYMSYTEAWKRVNEAQEKEFYLEAVTIQESIICDRLISYLVGTGAISRKSKLRDYPRFSRLLNEWKDAATHPISQDGYADLRSEVDDWREERNHLIHGMVKSHPGTPTEPIEDFLTRAKEAAEEGTQLARAVCNWHDKIK